ncbi:MAG TPA: glycoside hydrolase family 30 beta sandwich domain-containing protein [Polyangiaceae bacterium]|nr:glycoside hydrolase family 30 beta sandwich domain-containing protein [Polyangiaceae bacterium]
MKTANQKSVRIAACVAALLMACSSEQGTGDAPSMSSGVTAGEPSSTQTPGPAQSGTNPQTPPGQNTAGPVPTTAGPTSPAVSPQPATPQPTLPGTLGTPTIGAPTSQPPQPASGGGGGLPVGPDPTTPAPTTPVTPEVGGAGPGPDATPSATPEPVVVERPQLVTSAAGAYWQEGTATEMAGAAADVTVDPNTMYQTWLGFGGSFNEAGWDVLQLASEEDRALAVHLLFDPAQGAAFAWGRVPIGASDYAIERYTLDDVADDTMMESFSIDHDRALLIPYIKAALEINPKLRLWASPWTPPGWMKTNGKIDGTSKKVDGSTVDSQPDGQMKDDDAVLGAFALYLARFVEEYAKEGITIESVMPQNEPNYATRYPSCLWSAALMTKFVRDHLGPTFEDRGVPAQIWFGTMSNADSGKDPALLDALKADSKALGYVKGFGLQWNMIDYVDDLQSTKLPILQTEHKCGNYPWVSGSWNPNQPPNDQAYAEESWGLIRDWMNAGINSYSAWNMVLDTQGKNIDYDRPWPQNALLIVDRTTKKLSITPAYYVFRHFSYYVEPGAVRVKATGSNDALAFKNPDGSVVTVLFNGGGQAQGTTVGIGDTRLHFDVPAHGWATVESR